MIPIQITYSFAFLFYIASVLIHILVLSSKIPFNVVNGGRCKDFKEQQKQSQASILIIVVMFLFVLSTLLFPSIRETIAFCAPNQYELLLDIQKHINMKIPMSKDPKFSIDPSKFVIAPPKKKSNKSEKKNDKKPNKSKKNYSYSRKKAKKKKIEPKGYSKHDNKQRNRRSR